MPDCANPLPVRLTSVQDDWRAWLPEDKDRVFRALAQELEASYTMLSVSLDEAISLQQAGRIAKSRQAAGFTADLGSLFARPMGAMLRGLESHARHFGTVPNAAPLDPDNFRGERCQRAARMSALLSHVLLTQRSQFLHKVHVLFEMVEGLEKDFRAASEELSDGTCIEPTRFWLELDTGHYDLNTCLRESVVVLKSFLVALPSEELARFDQAARTQSRSGSLSDSQGVRAPLVRQKRAATAAGK